MCVRARESSAHFVTTAAPAPPIALFFNMNNYIHVPALEKLNCALAHILDIRGVCGDDVDDAQYPLLAGTMAVVVYLIVRVVCMRMAVRV